MAQQITNNDIILLHHLLSVPKSNVLECRLLATEADIVELIHQMRIDLGYNLSVGVVEVELGCSQCTHDGVEDTVCKMKKKGKWDCQSYLETKHKIQETQNSTYIVRQLVYRS